MWLTKVLATEYVLSTFATTFATTFADPLSRTISQDSGEVFVHLGYPAEFSPKVLNALKTDPLDVDIRLLSSVYFKLAERWLGMVNDPDLLETLTEVSGQQLKKKMMMLMDA